MSVLPVAVPVHFDLHFDGRAGNGQAVVERSLNSGGVMRCAYNTCKLVCACS
jgi:hypothetical protein